MHVELARQSQGEEKVTGVLSLAKPHLLTSPTHELLSQKFCPPQHTICDPGVELQLRNPVPSSSVPPLSSSSLD